ncbi:thermonuclease family protein [Clostridium sardiniense]|uniref:thermonuclease family protein n=1 Tax=Clostridium sardiniense TaxID=29369 RepID=UPI00195E907A|nr:micrococcal nuclease [Clostridium sardiniense]
MLHKRLKQVINVALVACSILGAVVLGGCSEKTKQPTKAQAQEFADKANEAIAGMKSHNSDGTYELKTYDKQPPNTVKATMVRDVDGDTIVVKDNGGEKKIRFLLVDTPETVKPETPVQPFGEKAKDFTKQALPKDSDIYVEYGKSKSDKYGRCLGFIYYKNKNTGKWTMLNEELVAKGLARVGYIYKDKEHLQDLDRAQDYAKEEKLNIWSKAGYVTNKGYNPEVFKN